MKKRWQLATDGPALPAVPAALTDQQLPAPSELEMLKPQHNQKSAGDLALQHPGLPSVMQSY